MKQRIHQPIEYKVDQFDKFVFYACIIDNLFLPYVWFISVPYTMPLIFLWLFKKYNNIKGIKEFKLCLSMIVIMVFSTIFGFILVPHYSYRNVVYLIQFTTMFLYYFMFSDYLSRTYFNVKKYMVIFILFVLVMAIFFNLDKSLYHYIKLIWNPRSGIAINETLYEGYVGYRYAFIWMDANNIAYMMNAIVLYLWCNEKTSFFIKMFSLLSLLFVLVSCMSNGGFLTFAISVIVYFIVEIIQLCKGKYKHKVQIKPMNLLLFVITLSVIVYMIPQIPRYLETGIALESLERMNANSADSRIQIWKYIIENENFLEYVFVGKGGVIVVNGTRFAPHNGHFYWILGYGFVAYAMFMYLVFRKRRDTPLKRYIWILPIMIGFTINVMLGEIKLMGIIMLLIACSASRNYMGGYYEQNR